ncbi:MAG: sigma-54-dependent Fis family transcriptional regulator [Methylibium sp.]|nr:sigma-54-dependent Fis family transcriptional regulator [Methylibium sp.]
MSLIGLREAGEHAHRILGAVREGSRGANSDEVMANSWTRCLKQHRLHPDRPHSPAVVAAAELAERQARLTDVIDCARYEMASLYQQLADAESAVVLTDTDGVILHLVSSPAFAEAVTPLGFHVGAVWSEAEAGTNGMGTCLVAAAPIAVRREDHFFTRLTSLTCSAVPVFDPQGRMTAVLDVTSRSGLQQQHSLVLLGMTAQMIENRLLELRHPQAHLLHFHSRPEFVYTLHEGRLALDAEGGILAGNRSALFQLGLASVAELRTRCLSDLFQTRLDEIVQRSLRSAFHPVVSYGAQGASRFFVVARPSASAAQADALPGPLNAVRPRTPAPRSEPRREAAASVPAAAADFGDPRLYSELERARRAIARDIPVLLHGETGSGKEVFARALHDASPKAGGAFVAINCASLPESLIEAELFGYRAGAFTGAQRSGRRGKILEADRGTLFLDEIGDMPLALQARLLRVLDERKVTPLGAEETLDVQFQLISASHHDLVRAVAEGRFREDLYYRLAGFEVALPPLRERSDKRALIERLLAREASAGGHPGNDSGDAPRLSAGAQTLLEQHPWPGNVRQLRHALRTALALADGEGMIGVEHLPSLSEAPRVLAVPSTARSSAASATTSPTPSADNASPALPRLGPLQAKEREVLLQLLEQHRWNVSNVAKALDVSRNTLYRKLHKLHIALSHPDAPNGAAKATRA